MTEDAPILKQVHELIDAAYNLGIDHAINILMDDYLEDSPLWNSAIDKKINRLTKLKKPTQ